MNKLLNDPRVQKCFLPLSFVCIFPIWLMLMQKAEHIPVIVYVLLALAIVFLCLDRTFKPWERERMEKMRKPGPGEAAGETASISETAHNGIESKTAAAEIAAHAGTEIVQVREEEVMQDEGTGDRSKG